MIGTTNIKELHGLRHFVKRIKQKQKERRLVKMNTCTLNKRFDIPQKNNIRLHSAK